MAIDPITLEVLRNALQSIAEEMGAVLKRTAFSPNIKERMDCSCALFNKGADMVAQAEHIPVHLGSMIESVVKAMEAFPEESIRPGDAIILNDPYCGGTHLPDITLVSPIFSKDHLVGFAANRAHHADVGGFSPGSLPGSSSEIYQEGLVIPPVKLYQEGRLNDSLMGLILKNVRTPQERSGDLNAQLSANKIGQRRFLELIERYGEETLSDAITEILDYSEKRMRTQIRLFPKGRFYAVDYLDNDGMSEDPVKIEATVMIERDRVVIDFEGTDGQREGNINAVSAVTLSCAYFVIRAITDPTIPANSGCYRPISVRIPEGSVLNPRPPAAVSAGNVETSQRIVDVLLRAFSQVVPERVVAGCQGTMNNVTIGGIDPRTGKTYTYYETIGGGQGGRPWGDGMDGVHTHMTNTLNTPIEALEIAYPILVEQYELRPCSGGQGEKRGGLGIIRSLKILESKATLSLQTERRRFAPFGLFGGQDGEKGMNLILRGKERRPLPSKVTMRLKENDVVRIETPGGGGYGDPKKRRPDGLTKDVKEGEYSKEFGNGLPCLPH